MGGGHLAAARWVRSWNASPKRLVFLNEGPQHSQPLPKEQSFIHKHHPTPERTAQHNTNTHLQTWCSQTGSRSRGAQPLRRREQPPGKGAGEMAP